MSKANMLKGTKAHSPGYKHPTIGQNIQGRGPGSGSPKGANLGTKPGPINAFPAPPRNVWHSGPPK